MRTLNLGILAHVDAGKTSLTERLLHAAGVIESVGRVDDGTTQTDTLALERQRGITIRSAVASFTLNGATVNLIDTPGHPDFIAEVERVLNVLDGAVLVVSAVEGVQPQTRVLLRTLRRLRVPTLLYVNKVDRTGAESDRVLRHVSARLTPSAIAMGTVRHEGTRDARVASYAPDEPIFRTSLLDVLTVDDEELLAAYVRDEAAIDSARLTAILAARTAAAEVHPLFFGSASTGAGIEALTAGITRLLPPAAEDSQAPARGVVFKIERSAAGEKLAYVRMFAGVVRTRDRVQYGAAKEAKVTAVEVFCGAGAATPGPVTAGQIGILRGLSDVRIGDRIGAAGTTDHATHFAPPTLETVVAPAIPEERPALAAALDSLAEQDPLVGVRQDDVRQELSVSLYGEVQKEVLQSTLVHEFGLDVTFRETTTVCVERPVGAGEAVEVIDAGGNPFLATVGLRVEPAPVDAGVTFGLEVELGSLPYAFVKAVEETVYDTLNEGLLGWQVLDCVVTMTRSGYWARQSHSHGTFDKSMSSTAGDFRALTPLVVMDALRRAGTCVYEPLHRFDLDLPADTLGGVLPVLSRLGGVPSAPTVHGDDATLSGTVPVASVRELQRRVPGLTRGEGVLESTFGGYQPVRGHQPRRARTDRDPLDRTEYLRHVRR